MRCPKCGSYNIGCKDSRESRSYPGRRHRRQKCRDCGATWATIEIPLEEYQELTTKRENHESLRKMRDRAEAQLLACMSMKGLQRSAVEAALRQILKREE